MVVATAVPVERVPAYLEYVNGRLVERNPGEYFHGLYDAAGFREAADFTPETALVGAVNFGDFFADLDKNPAELPSGYSFPDSVRYVAYGTTA